jgi:hypothetical protein
MEAERPERVESAASDSSHWSPFTLSAVASIQARRCWPNETDLSYPSHGFSVKGWQQ